jgi:hypothetical protein
VSSKINQLFQKFGLNFQNSESENKSVNSKNLNEMPVSEFLDTDLFEYKYVSGTFHMDESKDPRPIVFKVIRITRVFEVVNTFGYTHSATVSRAKGKKEYEASLAIENGKIKNSIIYDFYGNK